MTLLDGTTYDAAVRARSVGYYRNRRLILADVNLTIAAGGRWVLFGPNGVGKSTLLEMIAMRTYPNVGELHVLGGRTVAGSDPERRRARVVTVSAAFGRSVGPEMNPLTVVASGISRGSGYSADEAYEKAYAMMRRFGVAYLAGKRWHNLSEGERTRVMISRALVSPADLLIFDEPTTGLDLGGRETVLRELSALASRRDDRTMLLVTHQVEDIPAGFDHIAMMGRMTEHKCVIYLDAHPRIYATLDGNTTPGTITFAGPIGEGLTDKRLASMFGISLHVERTRGRWKAAFRSRLA